VRGNPARPSEAGSRPVAAFVLALVSACAMVGYAAYVLPTAYKIATTCNPVPKGETCLYNSFWGLSPVGFLVAAFVLLALGPLIGVVGVAAYARVRFRRSGGAVVIALALLSILGYGGAIVGAATGLVSGVLFLRSRRGPATAVAEWSGSYPVGVTPPRGAPVRPITERSAVSEWPGPSRPAARVASSPSPPRRGFTEPAGPPPSFPESPSPTEGVAPIPPPPTVAAPPRRWGSAPDPRAPPSSTDTFPRRMPVPRLPPPAPRPAAGPPAFVRAPAAPPVPPTERGPTPSWVPPAPPPSSRAMAAPGPATVPAGVQRLPASVPRPVPPSLRAAGPSPPAPPTAPVAPAPTPPPPPSPSEASRPPPPTGPLPKQRMHVWVCPNCKLVNAPWSQHCTKCGAPSPP
jgi:hypothetical protein